MKHSKRKYFDALASSDDYQPETQITPKQARTARHDSPPAFHSLRPSYLKAREANEEIADSGVLDDDVGSQEFIENLFRSNGLDPGMAQYEFLEDGASDIENEIHIEEPQSQIVYSSSSAPSSPSKPVISKDYMIVVNQDNSVELAEHDQDKLPFCPHAPITCTCTEFLLEEYHTHKLCLSKSTALNDAYERKIYSQQVRLKRLHESLSQTLSMLTPTQVENHSLQQCRTDLQAAQSDLQEARAAQREAEHLVTETERLRCNLAKLVKERSYADLKRVNDEVEKVI